MARLPPVDDIREGLEDKLSLRPIAIEDLLGRPQMALDRASMEHLIQGRSVLVTGAGGLSEGRLRAKWLHFTLVFSFSQIIPSMLFIPLIWK